MYVALVGQRHHQEFGALENALDLQLQEFRGPRSQRLRGAWALLFDQGVDALTERVIGDPDEAPRLHQADAGRGVRGLQQPGKHFLGHHGAGHEPAHIAPFGDHPIDGLAIWCAERVLGHSAIVETASENGISVNVPMRRFPNTATRECRT